MAVKSVHLQKEVIARLRRPKRILTHAELQSKRQSVSPNY